LSNSFNVSNGVHQGGVLSPFLFAVYLDGLLDELSASGVGCYWRWMFAGVICYADDIAILAPSASALRRMLHLHASIQSQEHRINKSLSVGVTWCHSAATEITLAKLSNHLSLAVHTIFQYCATNV